MDLTIVDSERPLRTTNGMQMSDMKHAYTNAKHTSVCMLLKINLLPNQIHLCGWNIDAY